MTANASGPPALPRSSARGVLALRLAPIFAQHLFVHPFRGRSGGSDGASRVRLAAYDTFLALLVAGFGELTGAPARRESGALAVRLNRIAFLVDDAFERRVAEGSSVEFADILDETSVSSAVAEFRAFLAEHCSGDQVTAIRSVLWDSVKTAYGTYADAATSRSGRPSVEELLAAAAIDSGVVLRQLADVFGKFSAVAVERSTLDEFALLGTICKLSDDLRDWRRDQAGGADNILSACLLEARDEELRATRYSAAGCRMPESWWRENCPTAFTRFAALYSLYYEKLGSTHLRRAADLISETGRLDLRGAGPGETAARVRPGDRP